MDKYENSFKLYANRKSSVSAHKLYHVPNGFPDMLIVTPRNLWLVEVKGSENTKRFRISMCNKHQLAYLAKYPYISLVAYKYGKEWTWSFYRIVHSLEKPGQIYKAIEIDPII